MALVSQMLKTLFMTGFVTFSLLVDLTIVFATAYFVWNCIVPAYQTYRNAVKLDDIIGPVRKHWFFGHRIEFPHTHEGLLKRVEITASHPTMLHYWLAPFITTLIVHHPDTAKPLLSSGAPKNEGTYGFLRPWIGDGLLTSNGQKWQRHRRLITPAFHFSTLRSYAKVTNDCVEVMLDKWKDVTNRSYDISNDVSLMTLDTMLKCAMSAETNCQHVKNHPFIHAVRDLTKIVTTRLQTPYLHPDFLFWRSSLGKQFKKCLDVVHSQGNKLIRDRRLALKEQSSYLRSDCNDSTMTGKKTRDFLDILIEAKDEHGNGLSDLEIRDEVNTFLVEGNDTTASGISWGLFNLAKHPDIQGKCRDEVLTILQDRHTIESSDLPKLVYLTMTLKESMRINPPVYSLGKKLHEPMTLKSKLNKYYETVVPKGSNTALNIFSLHRNKLLWDRPTEFDPERFTKENIAKRSPHAYLPFSAGSRNCIGQNFAMNEMKIALAKVLQRYRLYLDEDTPEPIMQPTLTLQSKDGIYIKLEKLSPSKSHDNLRD